MKPALIAALLLACSVSADYADEGYDAGYAHAPYGPPAMGKFCYRGCLDERPCFDRRTGACSPMSCSYYGSGHTPAQYEGRSVSKAETPGRRRQLQEEEYDKQPIYQSAVQNPAPQESYTPHQQVYPGYGAAEKPRCSCPYGSMDRSCLKMSKKVIMWIGFILLLLPGLWYLWVGMVKDRRENEWMSFQNWTDAGKPIPPSLKTPGTEGIEGIISQLTCRPEELYRLLYPTENPFEEVKFPRCLAGVVCFIASLAYLIMALGYGYVTRCDGRDFYYARYVDWAITTPLMLFDICHFGDADLKTKIFLLTIDFLMIISGLIGALIEDSEKWAFFGFSMLCFLPILWFLCTMRGGVRLCNRPEATSVDSREVVFQRTMNVTVITWIGYPIVWALAEGSGTICANAEAIAYTILDIISKSFFGWLIVATYWDPRLTAVRNYSAANAPVVKRKAIV